MYGILFTNSLSKAHVGWFNESHYDEILMFFVEKSTKILGCFKMQRSAFISYFPVTDQFLSKTVSKEVLNSKSAFR